ncbi:MAG: NPCBM/NEW2 domain-containing protein, partial [bacterium]
ITWVQATNVVYTTPAITGAILKYWLANGGRLYIGYPVSVEYSVADGRQQDFEKGTLTWVKNTDTVYMIDKVTPPQPPILTSQSRPLDHIFPTQDGTWLVKKSLFTVKGRSYTWIGYPGMPLVGGKAVFDVSMGHEAFQSDIGVQDDYSGNTYIRIYLDGKEYGNGYWFGKGSKTVSVNVPLQGVKQLRLDRSGYGINGVDFLEPRIITTKPAPLYIPLDGQVPPAQGPYLFFNEHVIHKGKDYHQWAIPGVPRIGGVSTFPVTGYSQFIGYAAMLEGKSCGVSFSIELDGKPVPEFNKRHIAAGDTIIPINVLLNNAKTMTLRTTVDAGNDIFKILDATGDRFVILEPKLFK